MQLPLYNSLNDQLWLNVSNINSKPFFFLPMGVVLAIWSWLICIDRRHQICKLSVLSENTDKFISVAALACSRAAQNFCRSFECENNAIVAWFVTTEVMNIEKPQKVQEKREQCNSNSTEDCERLSTNLGKNQSLVLKFIPYRLIWFYNYAKLCLLSITSNIRLLKGKYLCYLPWKL